MLRFELKGALRSLGLRPLQTALSALGVLVGVAAVVAMLSVGEGAKRRTLQEVEQLGISNVLVRGSPAPGKAPLTLQDAGRIHKSLPMVEEVLPIQTGHIRGLPIVATDASAAQILNLKTERGWFFTSLDVRQKQPVCVVGADIARSLGLTRELLLGKTPFRIVGVLENKATLVGPAEKSVWIPMGTSLASSQQLSDIIVHLKAGANLHLAEAQLQRLLDTYHPNNDFQVVIPLEVMKQRMKTQQTFNLVLASVAIVSLLVGGIGVANIMLATISTRTKEIGVRRALGATRRHILRQFLGETLLLTLGGAFAGLLLGILSALVIGRIAGWETAITAWSCLLALTLSVGVGLLSGLYPAMKAARLSPVSALSR